MNPETNAAAEPQEHRVLSGERYVWPKPATAATDPVTNMVERGAPEELGDDAPDVPVVQAPAKARRGALDENGLVIRRHQVPASPELDAADPSEFADCPGAAPAFALRAAIGWVDRTLDTERATVNRNGRMVPDERDERLTLAEAHGIKRLDKELASVAAQIACEKAAVRSLAEGAVTPAASDADAYLDAIYLEKLDKQLAGFKGAERSRRFLSEARDNPRLAEAIIRSDPYLVPASKAEVATFIQERQPKLTPAQEQTMRRHQRTLDALTAAYRQGSKYRHSLRSTATHAALVKVGLAPERLLRHMGAAEKSAWISEHGRDAFNRRLSDELGL
jgi:hypothetical protein